MKRNILFLSMVMVLLLVGCDRLPGAAKPTPTYAPVTTSNGTVVEGRIVPKDDASLFFTASGQVADILVSEGDEVTAGQVLASLGDRETFTAQVATAQLELTQAQQAYDDLTKKADLAYADAFLAVTRAEETLLKAQEAYEDFDTDDYQQQIDDAQVTKENAQDDLTDAEDEFSKYENLDRDNTDRKKAKDDLDAAQNKYDAAVRDYDRLVNNRDAAKGQLDLAQASLDDAIRTRDAHANGPDPDDLALAQARLDNAKSQMAAAEAALARLDLKAPFAGTIVKISISEGQEALPNQVVMVLADFSAWYVETKDLTENEVVRIEPGQSVIIVPDALPELELPGVVETIAEWYGEKSGDVTYETRLLLSETDPLLRWGMTVEVRFEP
jgi:multidrug resistance efflux pump